MISILRQRHRGRRGRLWNVCCRRIAEVDFAIREQKCWEPACGEGQHGGSFARIFSRGARYRHLRLWLRRQSGISLRAPRRRSNKAIGSSPIIHRSRKKAELVYFASARTCASWRGDLLRFQLRWLEIDWSDTTTFFATNRQRSWLCLLSACKLVHGHVGSPMVRRRRHICGLCGSRIVCRKRRSGFHPVAAKH